MPMTPKKSSSRPSPPPSKPAGRPLAEDAAIRLEQLRLYAWTTLQLAKRGDRLAQNRLATAAIGFSIVVHTLVFAIRFVVDDDRKSVAPPLEVVLVNSKSSTKPYKAELLGALRAAAGER